MSVHLKSRQQCCYNGFWYTQKGTGWTKQSWIFEGLCQDLLKHRKANPQFHFETDINKIRDEVDTENAKRCLQIPGASHFVAEGGGVPKYQAPRPSVVAVGSGASGLKLLKDLLEGDPVDPELANARAAVCVDCPQNGKGDWRRYFTVPASETIRHMLEARTGMKLSTFHDEKLNICEACTCPLKFKVHTNLQVILKHTDGDTMKQLPDTCWIKSENANPKADK